MKGPAAQRRGLRRPSNDTGCRRHGSAVVSGTACISYALQVRNNGYSPMRRAIAGSGNSTHLPAIVRVPAASAG